VLPTRTGPWSTRQPPGARCGASRAATTGAPREESSRCRRRTDRRRKVGRRIDYGARASSHVTAGSPRHGSSGSRRGGPSSRPDDRHLVVGSRSVDDNECSKKQAFTLFCHGGDDGPAERRTALGLERKNPDICRKPIRERSVLPVGAPIHHDEMKHGHGGGYHHIPIMTLFFVLMFLSPDFWIDLDIFIMGGNTP
jgi:hypothetical protein